MLGTDQSEDILCAEFPDEPKWMGGAEVWCYCEIALQTRCPMDCVYGCSYCVIFKDVMSPVSEYSLVKIIGIPIDS